jgi:hypothetical protein
MVRFFIILVSSIMAFSGCKDEKPSDPITAQPMRVPVAEARAPMSQSDKPWREDPLLAGKFLPDYPDDLQVIVHDGGPRFTDRRPEAVWVSVTARNGRAYRGKVLNAPQQLQSVRQGDEVLFLAMPGKTPPIQVSQKYLAERGQWVIEPCEKCGCTELFDAPSDLIQKVFPALAGRPNEIPEAFTSFCPICLGVQVIHKPDMQLE